MAVARMKFLDGDEEDLIHEQSIKTLNEIGVLVRSPSVLKILEGTGATVDYKTGIALISESMVNEALSKAPKRMRICSRDPKNDFEIPTDSIPYISTDGLTIYMRDLETGEKRNATRKDLADFAKLADALDGVDFFWPIVTVTDVPAAVHSTYEQWTSLKGGTLHEQGDALSALDAQKQIELAALIVGGKEELRKRPIFSVVCCPIAPLSFEKGSVEAQVELARAGIPVVSMSMSLSGMSSPVTVAGTITNANTENLASLVITQSTAPGSPHIYSSISSPINMTTGNMDNFSPEGLLISAATGQLAKRYGLPSMVGGWGIDGLVPGIQPSFTELSSYVFTIFTNTDLAPGVGGLDSDKGSSLEQMVIDSYLWENFRAFMRKFTISEETIALDVVKEVGHGNTFLTHPHTAKNFKKELFFRDEKKSAWEATLSSEMVPEAKEIAKKLLKEYEVEPIDRDIVKQGDALLKEYEKMLTS